MEICKRTGENYGILGDVKVLFYSDSKQNEKIYPCIIGDTFVQELVSIIWEPTRRSKL